MESLLIKNDTIYIPWKKSKQFKALATLSIGVEFGFLLWELNNVNNNRSPIGPLIGVIVSAVSAIIFLLKSVNLKKKAILRYNEGLDKSTSFKIKTSKNGLGIVFQF